MIVYQYDEITKIHTGNIQAQESPREPGKYLIPANATNLPPPPTDKNECAVWENGKWMLKPDFRGKVYWLGDGTEHTISVVGIAPPDDALSEKPVMLPTIEQQIDEINAKLMQIDLDSIRPLRAIAAGIVTAEDTDKLNTLTSEVNVLREELASLQNDISLEP